MEKSSNFETSFAASRGYTNFYWQQPWEDSLLFFWILNCQIWLTKGQFNLVAPLVNVIKGRYGSEGARCINLPVFSHYPPPIGSLSPYSRIFPIIYVNVSTCTVLFGCIQETSFDFKSLASFYIHLILEIQALHILS